MDRPCERNGWLEEHAARLLASYSRWTGKELVEPGAPIAERARRLFHAPFAVLSHDAAPEPILTYANRTALALFELTWEELIVLPSRLTAEPVERAQRRRLLETVAERGYIDDYRGVRVARTGRRFLIERATVWNLIDDEGRRFGQAATFGRWKPVDGRRSGRMPPPGRRTR